MVAWNNGLKNPISNKCHSLINYKLYKQRILFQDNIIIPTLLKMLGYWKYS